MIKTGIVINIMNKKAGIMTSNGEFVYVKTSKILPKIGEIHTAKLCKRNSSFYKYAITAASLIFISCVSAYSYYTSVTTIVLSINPSFSIKANRWNKIISSKALDSDGNLVLSNIKLANKSIDDGLQLLVKESKTKNYINNKYVKDKKVITVNIKSNIDNSIDISNFKNIIDSNKLNIKLIVSSDNNKDIDITANNKTINTFDFNPNSTKYDHNNKKSNKRSHPLKKPSLDTNSMEDKSSNSKHGSKNNTKHTTNEEDKLNNDGESENKNPNNTTSSIIEKTDTSNVIENKLQDEENKSSENIETPNDDESENQSYEIREKDSDLHDSDSSEIIK